MQMGAHTGPEGVWGGCVVLVNPSSGLPAHTVGSLESEGALSHAVGHPLSFFHRSQRTDVCVYVSMMPAFMVLQ